MRARLARYHDYVDVAFRGWNDAWLDPGFVDWNVAECLDYLRVPALVVQGDGDEYGTVRQVDEIVTRSYAPVDVELLAGCGHAPQIEQPERTLAAIAEFLRRAWNGSSGLRSGSNDSVLESAWRASLC